mmetsp:Transcript_19430/g.30858  ORF Transcript_19430/g.30858 Transcript_19430/m.30858 type:complete len:202 (-) Transcript_19430:76-681(-)
MGGWQSIGYVEFNDTVSTQREAEFLRLDHGIAVDRDIDIWLVCQLCIAAVMWDDIVFFYLALLPHLYESIASQLAPKLLGGVAVVHCSGHCEIDEALLLQPHSKTEWMNVLVSQFVERRIVVLFGVCFIVVGIQFVQFMQLFLFQIKLEVFDHCMKMCIVLVGLHLFECGLQSFQALRDLGSVVFGTVSMFIQTIPNLREQ